ncbi:CoA-disulfide reductase [Corynebacterium poyangense]|uniref:CoA-disulfide reductase n=1 Tax=Corynebacterium poyangense TaxID=2684405 RepID=A0A7H0SSG0_9CORY|nr:FAD-dependent oxidoreductase [Corynebacterium poyangense]MBZ8178381.1 FAD-dependent oxidoreductase [Corynebacterium poyangense]QNQ91485.1 CoA-disulfide reductase [Corynebacterium poyangense]
MPTTVIIGGVAGGMSTATRLRRKDEQRRIIVIESSGYVSFANCGLPYHISGTIAERSSLLLQTPESLAARFNIDVRVNQRAIAIDRQRQEVTVRDDQGDTYLLNYDTLVLSPGAEPFLPDLPGIERSLTLRSVEDLDRIIDGIKDAQSVALIGGGFIGIEVAENLQKLGKKVTILEKTQQILSPLDPEMSAIVRRHIADNGVTVLTNASITAIGEKNIELSDGRTVLADAVITAIGVRPATELAETAGLDLGPLGGIAVDDQQRTSDPKIFAVGDVTEKPDAINGQPSLAPLAQSANRQGRLIADVIAGEDVARRPVLGTAIVGAFGLATGVVGWNEKRARSQGRDIRIIHLHPVQHAGYYPGASPIHLKLVVDANNDAILGAQAVGRDGVDKRIDVISTAMSAGISASRLADLELAYAPQFGSAKDPINMAGFIAENLVKGERNAQWYEVSDYLEQGWTLVDVRTPAEYEHGAIPGSMNLPLDDIRERYQELAGHKVLVHCQVGLRGHIAATLLQNLGFTDVVNLDGGYLTWSQGTCYQ